MYREWESCHILIIDGMAIIIAIIYLRVTRLTRSFTFNSTHSTLWTLTFSCYQQLHSLLLYILHLTLVRYMYSRQSVAFPPSGSWIDYRCRLGNSSTAYGSSPSRGAIGRATLRPSGNHFFHSLCVFLHSVFSSYLRPMSRCLISFLVFPCASILKISALLPHFLMQYLMLLTFSRC